MNIAEQATRVVVVIQARNDSSRLPGKALLRIGQLSVLGHVIHRVKKIRNACDVVLATTELESDEALVQEAENWGIKVFRGSVDNVVERIYLAANKLDADYVLRITADCPLIDSGLADELIDFALESNLDFATNYVPPSFPDGLDLAVIRTELLRELLDRALSPHHLEHVTTYLEESPFGLNSAHVQWSEDLSGYRWTLDTVEDFDFLLKLAELSTKPIQNLTWHEIRLLLEFHPEISGINSHYSRNYGHAL